MKELHIIGGGPAGLAIGYHAKKNKIPIKIYEGSDFVGGNCRTIEFGDFKYDTGAHRFHNKDEETTSIIKSLLKDELLNINVPSKIFSDGKMINFPLEFTNLNRSLDKTVILKIIFENIFKSFSFNKLPNNFRDLAYKNYGKTLSELFLINYSEKLWGRKADSLKDDISGNRLKHLNIISMFKNMIGLQKKDAEHLDGSFYYPKNGYGTIFEAIKEYIGSESFQFSSKVSEIHHKENLITGILVNDKLIQTENLVSTLPLNVLINILRPHPPKEILEQINKIEFRFLRLGVICLDIKSFSENASIYFPEKGIPFTRIYEPKNRSKAMAPKDKTCIVVEVPCEKDDLLYNCDDDQFLEIIIVSLLKNNLIDKKNIIDSISLKVPYAYPILNQSSIPNLEKITSFVKTYTNLCNIGRSAQFQYLHTHDLFLQAKQKISQFI